MTSEILIILLLGGLVCLDFTEVAQTMFSQPLVSSTAVGFLWGDVKSGLEIGFLLQLLYLWFMPVGTAWFPDFSVAGVVGSSSFIWLKKCFLLTGDKVLFFVIILVFFYSYFCGWLVIQNRKFNLVFVRKIDVAIEQNKLKNISPLILTSLAVSFGRGAILALLGLVLIPQSIKFLISQTTFLSESIFSISTPVVVGFGIGSLFIFWGTKKHWVYTILGGLAGLTLAVTL
ncbi:MAG: hypothetical protein A2145_01490 [candidate division Zixibacteria bacterium RBG_16_40_9]|nr:MAG: hypothetical protein A2145_01490 [candidate division Zixibacteria bacterium RBG_16_40_9]